VTDIPKAVIAIDGKTVRRSGRKRDDKLPIHMVFAFAPARGFAWPDEVDGKIQ
jgi:hypothetical protein